MSSCTGSGASKSIDAFLGATTGNSPVLTSVPAQIVQQGSPLYVDINNVQSGLPGNDDGMTYACYWNAKTDGVVDTSQPCSSLPGTNPAPSFSPGTGIFTWTPPTTALGPYQIRIDGSNKFGTATRIFSISVRLQFAGLTSLSNVQGNQMTLNWTANPNSVGYDILIKGANGSYSVYQTVTDPNASSVTLTGLVPQQTYAWIVNAVDSFGNLDGNQVSLSAVTANLVNLLVSAGTSQLSPGESTTVTVRLKDDAGNYLNTSGLNVSIALNGSGTSQGTFSATNDLGNGIYTATFTATTPGTVNQITASIPQFYYVQATAPMTVMPLQIQITASQLTLNPGRSISLNAQILDYSGNPVSWGGQGLSFSYSGGTSSATITSAVDYGNGTYGATLTGVNAGTAITIGASLSTTSTIASTVAVTVAPYSLVVTSSLANVSVTRTATVTGRVVDWQGNYVTTGGMGMTFSATGSPGILSIGTVTDHNNGTYTATVTGLSLGSVAVTAAVTPSYQVTTTAPITVQKLRLSITTSAAAIMPGQTATLTGTVKDWQGNVVGVGGESFNFGASGGTSSGTIGTVTDLNNGVYTSSFTASVAGTALTITGSITDSYQVDTTASITVKNWQLYISAASSSVAVGQTTTFTVTVKDSLGNQATSGGQNISVFLSGGTSSGSLSSAVDNGNGTYTITFTGGTPGTAATVSASMLESYQVAQTASITVVPIYLAVSVAQSQLNPGGTSYVYAQVQNSGGTNLTAGAYTISFSYGSGTSTGSFSSVTSMGNGLYRATFTAGSGGTAVTISASANSAYVVASTQTITVVPWSIVISAASINVTAGQSTTVTAKVQDYAGNYLTSGGMGISMNMTTSGVGNLSSVTDNSNGTYTATFTGSALGSTTIGASMSSSYTIASTPTITVGAVHIALSAAQTSLNPGGNVTITAQLRDSGGNNITTGTYSIGFSYSGGTSTGAFGSTLSLGLGQYSAQFTGGTGGTATTVSATSTLPFVVDTTVNITVVPWNIVISAASTSVTAGQTTAVTARIQDYAGNYLTTGGMGVNMSLTTAGVGSLSSVTDNSNGTYTATFTATGLGSTTIGATISPSYTIGMTPTIAVTALHIALSAAQTSLNPGNSVTIDAQLKDSLGNALLTGSYSISFSYSGGTSTGTIGSTLNLGSGLYSTQFTGNVGGSATTVTATTTVPFVVDATVGITVVPWNIIISSSSTAVTVGQAATITAKIKDYTGTYLTTGGMGVNMNLVTSGIGSLTSVTDNSNGTYTATFTATGVGSTTVNANISPSYSIGSTPTIAVSALHIALSAAQTSLNPGASVSVSAQLKDSSGNNLTTGTYAITFSYSGGTSTGTIGSTVNLGAGLYTTQFTGNVGGTATTVTASATVPFVVDSNVNLTVVPWNIVISASATALTAGQTATITAKIKDYTGTYLTTGGMGVNMNLVTSGIGSLTSVTDNSNGTYTATFTASGVGSTTIGATISPSYTISATPTMTVTSLHIALTAVQTSLNPGGAVTVSAQLKDSSGNALTTGTYAISFANSGGTSTGSIGSTTNAGSGVYTAQFTGGVAGTATTVTASTTVPYVVDSTVNLTVVPWVIEVTTSQANLTINETATLTAKVKNWNNQYITTGGMGLTISLTSSSAGSISSTTDNGNGTYAANFAASSVGSTTATASITQSYTVTTSPTLTVGEIYIHVTVGSGLSSTTLNSGNTVTATATLTNSSGTTVAGTGYNISFFTSGGTSTVTPASSVSQVSTGVYQISYQGVQSGTALTVTASATQTYAVASTATITVQPSMIISAANSNLTVSSSLVKSGQSVSLTATMKDAAGNLVPGLTPTLSDTTGSGIGTGTFSSVTDNGNGTYSATFTGGTEGTNPTVISVASGSVTVTATVSVTVTSGVPSQLILSGPTSVNGQTCSAALSFTLEDSQNNTATVSANTTFTPSGLGSYGQLYQDPGCTVALPTVTVYSGGSSSGNFYFMSNYPTTYNISLSATGITQTNAYSLIVYPMLGWLGASGNLDLNGSGNFYVNGTFDASFSSVQNVSLFNESGTIHLLAADSGNSSIQNFNITNVNSISIVGTTGRVVNNTMSVPTGGVNSGSCTSTAPNAAVSSWCTGGQYTNGSSDGMLYSATATTVMSISGTNYMFVADYNNHRIVKYNFDTGAYLGWTGLVGTAPTGGATNCNTTGAGSTTPGWCTGGTATASPASPAAIPGTTTGGSATGGNQFRYPRYITNDGTYLYVEDSGNNRLVQLDPVGGLLVHWMGIVASTTYDSNNGMTWPTAISCLTTTQSDGTSVLVTGQWTPSWCSGGATMGNANNTIAQGSYTNIHLNPQFNGVRGIALVSDGTYNWMLITDQGNNRVSRYLCGATSATPNCATTAAVSIGGTNYYPGQFFGWTGYVMNGFPANAAAIPAAISSLFNYTSAGTSNTVSNGWAFGGQISGSSVTVSAPLGMTINGSMAYIADFSNQRVTQLNWQTGVYGGWIGRVSTTPNSGASGCAGASSGTTAPGWCVGGSATTGYSVGTFYNPYSIVNDGTYLYVADNANYRVSIHNMSTGAPVGAIGLRANNLTQNWMIGGFPTGSTSPVDATGNTTIVVRDYSMSNPYQMVISGNYMYVSDNGTSRIKRYNWLTGAYAGWIGTTNGTSPTGGDAACVGALTGGFTPGWCIGGGWTTSNTFGFNGPQGLASDGTYLYVADTSNNRIVKINQSTGAFVGWMGYIGATPPSGGDTGCSTATTGQVTPGWCIGGVAAASAGYILGGFSSPEGMAGFTDTDGHYYLVIGDAGNYRLQKIDVNNVTSVSWVGTNNGGSAKCGVANTTMLTGWCTTSGVTTTATNTTSDINNGYLNNQIYGVYVDTTTSPYYVYATASAGRVLRFNASTGAFGGWIGSFSAITNSNCSSGTAVANTGTPAWCTGGTVTTGTGNGQMSSAVYGVYSDGTYLYVSDAGNYRIMKYNLSSGAYIGWMGQINSTVGLGGGTGCSSAASYSITPAWCTGGTAMGGWGLNATSNKVGLNVPHGLWGMGSYLYVNDTLNGRILQVPSQ